MKKLFTLALLCVGLSGAYAQNDAQNMSKLGSWAHPDPSRYYNDCWGYAANGREYAILGSNWGTHFFDVTDPANPVEVNSFAGNDTDVIWRDFKTNGHYAYGVADGGNNSLQIFDLSGLPGSVTKVYDSQALTHSTHNVYIDNNRLYLCLNTIPGMGTRAVDIISIADPVNPVYLNTISSASFMGVHDAFVRNDTAYLSGEYAGFYAYDVQDPMNPILLSSITNYPPAPGYNHSNWTTPDGKTLVFADEVPGGLPLKIYDISDIQNPVFSSTFQSNVGATPHNPYILGNHVIISYYKDGVQVFDISNPANPVRAGYYDTYPDNIGYDTGSDYEGCWGVYPFLPSKNIIASDITYGLFVLSNPYDVNVSASEDLSADLQVYPNPAKDVVHVTLPVAAEKAHFTLHNTLGQQVQVKAVATSATDYRLDTQGLVAGMYTLRINADGKSLSKKLVIK